MWLDVRTGVFALGRWFGRFFFFDFADKHFVVLDFYLEAVDFDSRIIFPSAIVDAESPSVPGAGDGVVFDVAFGQGRTHVGAQVVNRVPLVFFFEYGHHAAVHDDGFALVFFKIADVSDHFKITHLASPLDLACVWHRFWVTL